MSAESQLTILVALKDRVPFTLRWMAYADRFRFPFKVLLADGGTDDRAERALSNRAAFPNVDYQYVRYSPDRNFCHDYWTKLADALSRVHTPFVAIADNDDLFVVSGVRQAVEFLAAHPHYAACGGHSAIFWVTPAGAGGEGPCYGKRVHWKSSTDGRSLDDDTALGRIRQLSLGAMNPAFYHVRRTQQLRQHLDAICRVRLHDAFLNERLLLWFTAMAGKTKQLDTLYIARQWNAAGGIGRAYEAEHGDWLGRLLLPTWSQDFTAFVEIMSTALAAQEAIPLDEARRSVVQVYRSWMAPQLLGDLLAEPTVTLSMPVVIRVVQRLLGRSPDNLIRRIARRLYRRSRWISLDALHGTQLRARPVPSAEHAFRPIHEFLASGSSASLHSSS